MPAEERALDAMVTTLVPSLSRSLAEQFNVFLVMHHGTHEKQLSNVFAWLLGEDGTHGLGDAFQRLFVEQVNQGLPVDSRLPAGGYQVAQEVDTGGPEGRGGDIADIVLTGPSARVVVENYEFSDGHGHDYGRYRDHGAAGGQSAVVLLCAWRRPALQTDGWEDAVVVTYPELLQALKSHIAGDPEWQRMHPRQHSFINELVQHFTEGPGVVSGEDQIAFIKAMCDTGESARYGQRPQEDAAQEFADLLALHAKRQFEEGRRTLASVKRALKRYAERTLVGQVNEELAAGRVTAVQTRFVGKWEWCVELRRADSQPTVYLEYGPTAVVENGRAGHPVISPDYTKIFVTRQGDRPRRQGGRHRPDHPDLRRVGRGPGRPERGRHPPVPGRARDSRKELTEVVVAARDTRGRAPTRNDRRSDRRGSATPSRVVHSGSWSRLGPSMAAGSWRCRTGRSSTRCRTSGRPAIAWA